MADAAAAWAIWSAFACLALIAFFCLLPGRFFEGAATALPG
jgi:hypothetical protein